MNTIDLNLRDIYRASDVTRWGVVKVARNQSVAEHSFQVAMIAMKICSELECHQDDINAAVRLALFHDLPEVLTGDLPTPLKSMLGPKAMKAIEELEGSITYMGHKLHCYAKVKAIVKLADLIEAVAFLHSNAMTDHGMEVQAIIRTRIQEHVFAVTGMRVLEEILHGPETTMDSLTSLGENA